MQVNKLQFGQSNYKLDQISLELILESKRHYLFYSGKEKGQNLKQLDSLEPENDYMNG
jgi:hypothetical protein